MDPDQVDADREAISSFFEAHPLFYDGTRRPASVTSWLHDMELIFRLCHIEARLQVPLATRCLTEEARMWWLAVGEQTLPNPTWADFRDLMIEHYLPAPEEGAAGPYRDPEIYRDMRHERYLSFSAIWHAYPQESMAHYCQRFQEAMMPHIPQDIDSPELQTLVILRNGVPPHIRRFVLDPMRGMTVAHMVDSIIGAEFAAQAVQANVVDGDHQAPVDDAGLPELIHEPGPLFPEDPIPAVPLQEIPAHETEIGMDTDDQDIDDFIAAPEDQPEDPPVYDIPIDDEDPELEQEDEEDPDLQHAGWLEAEEEDFEEDPEEFPLQDEDWEVDSDVSVVTDELIHMYDGKVVDTSITVLTILREQLAQINQRPQANDVPPQNNRVPPVVPPIPDVQPEVQPEVPIAPAGAQMNLPPVREDLLYERFRRMKAPEFEGPTDPIAADNWLIDIQVILDFMRLTEQEKVLCASFALKKDARHWWMTVQMRRDVTTMSWQDFVTEFRAMYFNREILAAQQDEFTSLRQGTMMVMEAVNKFEQLARLCPELVPNETEKVRLMMKMFRSDIAKQFSAGESPPTRVSDCISRAIRAEYWNNRDKEERAQIFKAKREEKAMGKQTQPRQNFETTQKGQPHNFAQSSKQFGKNK
ncbi:hypothetical protein TIFTF001_047274 [Ficus carica]|uniref:Retrotransposon gag domain-containing protein n=1 Tax=Ficus carica TaxID=3494 RepID=A0AA87YXL2_FICCA|nr:hypothetical protein TIFTF001_047273 [Ficus carica]GMN21417.1 hypothetical protein TIFTF001_047274 [Ficus carica]